MALVLGFSTKETELKSELLKWLLEFVSLLSGHLALGCVMESSKTSPIRSTWPWEETV